MALLKCPECAHDVSDKAVSCPNCGYPMNTPSSTKPRIRNGKPTKLPNGYGSIVKLSGKRSKPFRAVKTDKLSLIHISEPTRPEALSRMPSSA